MSIVNMVAEAAARPNGMCVADIQARSSSVGQALWYLQQRGLVFKAKISHKKVRYFDTQARADACVARTPKPKACGWGVTIKRRPAFDPAAPMVFTKDTKYTIAPPPPRCLHTNTHGSY